MTQEHENRIQSYVYKMPVAIQEVMKRDIEFGYSLSESHYLPILEAERAKVAKLVEGLERVIYGHRASITFDNGRAQNKFKAAYDTAVQLIAEYKTT